ncbi:MAG: hypothetical protein CMD61_01675 [Gammaproteobacteria bacterium]|nr:hypothetical protein [Gammaproteobacteria bacterium]|tara:strand:- start:255 stop:587 length:333 start_codon:yes stop_codon:yes gene_type:complete
MKRVTLLLFLMILVSGCQVTNLVNSNSSKLTPEYACILQETYSKNNEEAPEDLSKFIKEENVNCEGSAVKEDEPEYEVVKIIRSEKKEEKKEKKDKDDDDFFIVKKPRIK